MIAHALLAAAPLLFAQAPAPAAGRAAAAPPPVYDARIVRTYPHDRERLHPGPLLPRRHALREHRPGRPLDDPPGPPRGRPGAAVGARSRPASSARASSTGGDQIVSTHLAGGIGYRWDRRDAAPARRVALSGRRLGAHPERHRHHHERRHAPQLRFLDPATLAERRRSPSPSRAGRSSGSTSSNGSNGEIFANVWHTAFIVRIDPGERPRHRRIDLRAAGADNRGGEDDVLNGIAYDAARDRLFVTGKNWANLYEIDLVPRAR